MKPHEIPQKENGMLVQIFIQNWTELIWVYHGTIMELLWNYHGIYLLRLPEVNESEPNRASRWLIAPNGEPPRLLICTIHLDRWLFISNSNLVFN